MPGYFLQVSNSIYITYQLYNESLVAGSSACLSCEVYSCSLCQTRANSNNILSIVCLTCLPGFTLVKNNCISCSPSYYFNVTAGQCTACNITNCINCNANACLWCADGYIVSSASPNTCVNITVSISNIVLSQAF